MVSGVNIPHFCHIPDLEERNYHTANFDLEIYKFTHSVDPVFVNIAHFSTDMDNSRSEMEKIVKFMQTMRFTYKHDSNLHTVDDIVDDVDIGDYS